MADPLRWLFSNPESLEELARCLDPRAMASGMGTAPSEGAAQFGSNFVPFAGDAVGTAQDLAMYYNDPSTRKWWNYGLTAAGMLQGIPAASTFRRAAGGIESLLDARGFKRVKKTGRFVGAPEWIKSPDDVLLGAEEYAQRIERALDAGVDPDYFYRKGEAAIREITDSPQAARNFAETVAITSSEAPVRSNVGWSVKAFDQHAAGVPINTGKYPVETSKSIDEVLAGKDPHLGIKRHRCGQGLGGVGRQMPDDVRRAPNDRFEIRSLRYGKDSASEQQHYFIDRVRQIAREIVLAFGLARHLSPEDLTIVVNTGDDFEHYGLYICPDLIRSAIPWADWQTPIRAGAAGTRPGLPLAMRPAWEGPDGSIWGIRTWAPISNGHGG